MQSSMVAGVEEEVNESALKKTAEDVIDFEK